MIREVLPDLLALVIFSVGGALYGLIIIRLIPHSLKKIKGLTLDFLLGLLGGVIFLILTEIYYNTVVTYYTLFCYLVGCVGVLFFFSERKPKPTKNRPRILSRFFNKKMTSNKTKNALKKQNKTPKLKGKASGNT